ncbi:YybS family protein [Paenibacillus sp. alder61]|uniref:DUF2232 domain-containing protein n=1 Tax=Paenibacillus sp. alder61 TaxID=2862948 RepID=UPI001CD55C00|nr:DUF2232 domain-containing protein [Paenibacillus sp. alder61]MCA1295999.1 YybS family protein [Paenibacillus sp. alder61]
MKLRWTSVAWSVVYLLLLLSLATPLTVVTAFFLIVPGVLLYTTLSFKTFALHVVPVWLICTLIFGPFMLLQAIYFIVPAIVMGHLYKKRASAVRTILSGAGTIMGMFLLVLLISTVFFDFNLATSIEDMINTAMAPLQNMADSPLSAGVAWSPELSTQLSNLTVRLIPFTMVVCALIITTIAHAVVRPTLGSMGHIVPKLPLIRDWRLPRSLIWYYFAALLLQMFGGESVAQGFLGTILLNITPLLQFLFMIQSASLFFFAAYHRKWNPAIPVLLVVAMVFFPPLRIVGILDIAFPLREMLTRPRR